MNPLSNQQLLAVIKAGIIAIAFMTLMIPVQIIMYVLWPHPTTVVGWFELLNSNWVLGLFSLDVIYMISMVASILFYISLFYLLRKESPVLSMFAVVLGVVGLTIYFNTNIAFEMLNISQQYAAAVSEQDKSALIGAGKAIMAQWTGSAYDIYYVMNGVALILFFAAMIHDSKFRKSTAWWGMAAGILMTVPATAGVFGMAMAFLSLIPWIVFSVLVIMDLTAIIKNIQQQPSPAII